MTKIEEVARAMHARRVELLNQPLARIWPDLARAAIEAMREPTAAMIDAGIRVGPVIYAGTMETGIDQGGIWGAMIDAALSEKK